MALTRKFLSALGIEPEKIDEIITAHSESIEFIKSERDKYKTDAEALPEVQKELNDLKETVKNNSAGNEFEEKYNNLKAEYDKYKEDQEEKAIASAKEKAYRELLKKNGVSDKRLDAIMKITNLSDMTLDDEGKLNDADKLSESIQKEWSDFITVDQKKGADTSTPPYKKGNEGHEKSRAAILAAKYHQNLYGGGETKEE